MKFFLENKITVTVFISAFVISSLMLVQASNVDVIINFSKISETDSYQIFYTSGKSYNESKSVRVRLERSDNPVKAIFQIDAVKFKKIRIDPGNHKGNIYIDSIILKSRFDEININSKELSGKIKLLNNISSVNVIDNSIAMEATGDDPFFELVKFGNINKNIYRYILFCSFIISYILYIAAKYMQILFKHAKIQNYFRMMNAYIVKNKILSNVSKIMSKIPFEIYMLSLAFIYSIYTFSIGWFDPILDVHSFRQTQTALTSYFFVKDGFRLDYLTPLFGYPWSIPFEFPIYQAIVAISAKFTNYPLDQIGRFVSILFFYFSLPFVAILLKDLKIKSNTIFLALSLIILSPAYLFWSRTFMIESTAMFFSIVYVVCSIRYQLSKNNYVMFCSVICAILGGLTKITTLVPFVLFTGLLTLFLFYKNEKFLVFIKRAIIQFLIILPALLLAVTWTKYGDSLKLQNELSSYITSENLSRWNFGTLKQRLDIKTWIKFFHHIKENLSFVFILWVILYFVGFFRNRNRNKLNLVLLGSFVLTILVFTNLYFVHNYYFYPVCIFGGIFMAIQISSLSNYYSLEKMAIIVTFILLIFGYNNTYFKSQNNHQIGLNIINLTKTVKTLTSDDDVIVVCGDDWNSQIPYYSQRKAIMITHWGGPDKYIKNFESSVSNTGTDHINLIIISKNKKMQYEYIFEILKEKRFIKYSGETSSEFDIYIPIDKRI